MDLLWKVTQLLDPYMLVDRKPYGFLQIAAALMKGPFKQRRTPAYIIHKLLVTEVSTS